ncbi:MAG: NADH-quinone oxidoreductase subunit N [Herpetosiphonaceae bacterium]|nr:MAG: NADH-quinone oxidoreductase subunit N [Herpetosiphonaceae bacterium]
MTFELADVPRLMPEILLTLWGSTILLLDVFTRWRSGPEGLRERSYEAATMALMGLAVIFALVFIQGGYLINLPERVPEDANPLTRAVIGALINLRAGGAEGTVLGNAFIVDPLTHLARLTFIGAAIITVMLTINYRPSRSPGEFYSLLLFSTVGMSFMAASGDLILIYLAIELTSIPLYILSGYFINDRRSTEAGMKYFLFGALSSAILLYGMSLAFGMTGSTSLDDIAAGMRQGSPLLIIAMIFVIAGMGYKVAVFPFHAWAPDVYQGAPTTITAFISTASKMAGFLVLLRVLSTGFAPLAGTARLAAGFGGWASILAIIAFFTIIFGNLGALPQTNAKRLLAYSSIAHAGFLLLGMLGVSTLSTPAMLYYLVVYTLTNLGAFGALAIIAAHVGGDEISDLNGLGWRSPLLAMLMTVMVLSLAGVPPLSGFFAKFYIFMAAWEQGAYWLVVAGVLMTIVSLYYYLRLLKAMYIEPRPTETSLEIPRWSKLALSVSTLLVVVLGIYPSLILGVLENVATRIAAR